MIYVCKECGENLTRGISSKEIGGSYIDFDFQEDRTYCGCYGCEIFVEEKLIQEIGYTKNEYNYIKYIEKIKKAYNNVEKKNNGVLLVYDRNEKMWKWESNNYLVIKGVQSYVLSSLKDFISLLNTFRVTEEEFDEAMNYCLDKQTRVWEGILDDN